MARNITQGRAMISVEIGGVEQAKKHLDQLQEAAKKARAEVETMKEEVYKASENRFGSDGKLKTGDALKEANKQAEQTNKIYNKQLNTVSAIENEIHETILAIGVVEKNLSNVSGLTKRSLTETKKMLEGTIHIMEHEGNFERVRELQGYLEQINAAIKRLTGSNKEYTDYMNELGTVSDSTLSAIRKRLEELIAGTEKGSVELSEYKKQLAEIAKEEENRRKAQAAEVMADLDTHSVDEINAAIKATEQLRDAQARGSQAWEMYNKQVDDARAYLKKFDDDAQRVVMDDKMSRLNTLSTDGLAEVKKYWQAQAGGAEAGSQALRDYETQLSKVMEEESRRADSKASGVMGNLQGSSVKEIQEAIKATEELRSAQKLGSDEWKIYNEEIERAKKYLADYEAASKETAMADRMTQLGTLSADALAETKKYWEGQVRGAEQGSVALQDYQDQLAKVVAEERDRQKAQTEQVMQNLDTHSVDEINAAIKATEELRNAQARGSQAWEMYNRQVEDARAYLKKFDDEATRLANESKMTNLADQSTASLAELKKYWQAQVDGANMSNAALSQYKAQLDAVISEEQDRRTDAARQTLSQVEQGTFDGTIKQTEEAIKQLEEYKKSLKTTDTTEIKRVEEAIALLGQKTAEVKEGYISMRDALNAARSMTEGTWSGSLADLEKLKKSLLEYRKQLKMTGREAPEDLEKVDEALLAIDKQTASATRDLSYFNELVNKRLDSAPLNELKQAAEELQKRLAAAERNTEDYVEANKALKKVNSQIKDVNDAWKEHDGTVKSVAKRLIAYVAVYGGFNAVKGYITGVVQKNIELSDSLADIEKTTGLSAEAVSELSSEIRDLDTRTTSQELHDLAYEAGKLGIGFKQGSEGVLGFVKAGNQVLAALGEDLGGPEAIRSLMKINDLLGETTRLGVEKALLSTGSAINELTMRSTASAEPMVDIVTRLGAMGKQAGMTMADIIALGSTVDSLGLHAEMSGTAITKFISSMMSNSHDIEYALQIPDGELERLMEAGHAMDAMILVLERMKGLDKTGMQAVFKDLGSEGSRMVTVFGSLVDGVDRLKEHVQISNKAFKDATSITNEYNIKNNNLAAVVQRIKNTIDELTTNSKVVGYLSAIADKLKELVDWLIRSDGALKALMATLVAVAALLAKNLTVAMLNLRKTVNSFSVAYRQHMAANAASTGFFSKAVRTATATMKGFYAVLKANIINLAVIAVAELVYWMTSLSKTTVDLNAATDEMNEKIAKEELAMRALFDAAQNENNSKERKKELIDKINNRYGSYLGFMLSEEASANQLAAAYDLVNAKMRERQALMLKNKMEEQVADQYAGELMNAQKGIMEVLESTEGISPALAEEAMRLIEKAVLDNVNSGEKAITDAVYDILTKNYTTKLESDTGLGTTAGREAYNNMIGDLTTDGPLEKYIRAQADFEKSMKATATSVNSIINKSLSDQREANKNLLKEANKEFLSVYNEKVDQSSAVSMIEHNKRVKEEFESYITIAQSQIEVLNRMEKQLGEEAAAEKAKLKDRQLNDEQQAALKATQERREASKKEMEEERKQLQDQVDARKQAIDELNKWAIKPGVNIWGTDKEYLIKSAQDLKDYYAIVKATHAEIRENMDFSQVYGGLYKNAEEARKVFYDEMVKTRERLKNEFGVNMSLDPWSPPKGGSSDKKVKERIEAALAALEAYYNEQQGLIKEMYIRREITETEMNERLNRNEERFLKNRVELRKRLLGQDNTFDQSLYGDYFEGKDLDSLAKHIKKMGAAMTDGMQKELTVDLLKIQQITIDHMKKIEEIILSTDYDAQTKKQYQQQLESLRLFWGDATDISQEGAKRRIEILSELAKESTDMTANGLAMSLAKYEEFEEWLFKGREDAATGAVNFTKERMAELQALLEMLQRFNKDLEEAQNKTRRENTRVANEKWEKLGLNENWDAAEKEAEDQAEMARNLQSLGLASQGNVDDMEVQMYRVRLESAQAYYNYILTTVPEIVDAQRLLAQAQRELAEAEAGGNKEAIEAAKLKYESQLEQTQNVIADNLDATRAMENMEKTQMDWSEKQQEMTRNKLETLSGYTDAVVSFSEQMGEAAFGEVEDRKAAAKQLLSTTMQLTKNLIMEKVKELLMKQTLGKKELAFEQAQQKQQTAMHGQQVMTDLTVEGASTTGKVAAGIAGGSAKTIGELGWWGIPLIAVISAALSALMGAAMGALNKAKSEVSSATGVGSKGRVAAGMLTYAEGNYPVMGADGVKYNAKYEPRLKTGLYSGGAHFGIFAEKKPEIVVDGDTTEKIMLNYPAIYESILTIKKHGRLQKVVPTYAEGLYPESIATALSGAGGAGAPSEAAGTQMRQMQEALASNTAVMALMLERLKYPITANVNPYGKNGAVNQLDKSEKWMKRKGLIKG